MGYGVFEKLAIETSHITPGSLTNRLDFLPGSTIGLAEEFIDANGLRGTLSRDISKDMVSLRHVGGNLKFMPTTTELRTLLPWMLGAAESGGGPYTYAVADTRLSRWVTVDRVDNRFEYTSCAVDNWTIHASKGNALEIDLDVVGFDETVSATAFNAALTLDTASLGAFVFSNLALTIGGVTYQLPDLSIHCGHSIDRDRFFNSPTLTATNPQDRVLTGSLSIPYSAATALYGLVGTSGTALIATTAPALVATFTNGVHILTITLAAISFPRKSPQSGGRGEIMLPIDFQAFASGATKEISITLAV